MAGQRERVERLWRIEGLRVPPRRGPTGQKALGGDGNSAWALPALRPIHIWSYDFVTVRTLDGGAVRVLNVVDEFIRIALGSRVACSIGARDVVVHLDHLFEVHGQRAMIRSDNGREFVAQSVHDWLRDRGVERFNGSMRDEFLNGKTFRSVTEVRVVVNGWLEHYKQTRPHRALKMKTPAGFAAAASATAHGAKLEVLAW